MTAFSDKSAEGVFDPGEIADLRQIFDEACRRMMIAPHTEAAEMLAQQLLGALRAGVKDRDELLRLIGTREAA
jgi:hypothetical protein